MKQGPLYVERLTPDWNAIVDTFVRAHPNGRVYSTQAWRGFLSEAIGGEDLTFIARRGSSLVGILPAWWSESSLGGVINSLPWFGTPAGCLLSDSADSDARAALVEALREEHRARRALSTTIVLTAGEQDHRVIYDRVWPCSETDRRIGQHCRLPKAGDDPGEAILRMTRQKTRNLIRKGLKQGFRLLRAGDDDDAWRFLQRTHEQNMESIGGRFKPTGHFRALRRLPARNRQLYLALADGIPVAALLLLRTAQSVEYITPVIQVGWRSRQPLSFLIYHAMVDAVIDGLRVWDWGGTWMSQVSLHHFKRGWGAIDSPYNYLVHSDPASADCIRAHRSQLVELFPYTYVYPFSALDGISHGP